MMRFYQQAPDELPHRFYWGVDLHARTMYLCILDHAGQVVFDKNMPATSQSFLQATGRRGGTDELLGRGGIPLPPCLLRTKERARDPDNVFGAAACGHPESKFAAAPDANESTAFRETRELKQEFFGIPHCAY